MKSKDLVMIIKAGFAAKVQQLEYNGLKVTYGSSVDPYQVTTKVIQNQNAPQFVQDPAHIQDTKQLEFEQMMFIDPVAYEDSLALEGTDGKEIT